MAQHKNDSIESGGKASSDGPSDAPDKPRIDWEDPAVPIGDSPPLARWPLAVSTLGWMAWVVFLATMLLTGSVGTN